MDIKLFKETLLKYEDVISDLLGNKYGITSQEYIAKCENAIKKSPNLLKCEPSSLFGSIMYFAEIGLPFNSPEGFGYILPYSNRKSLEATPIVGYRGLIEIAYRNEKIKSIRVQAVYENDKFEYEYGTNDFINHKPLIKGDRGSLIAVYCVIKMQGIDPLFVVVHKEQLDEIQKMSKSGNSEYSPYNNSTDVFNIMQCKVAIKLLFKTLPKSDNSVLIKALEMDNKFDYEKNVTISATESGYEVKESEVKTSALKEAKIEPINVVLTEALKSKQGV
jgi:recombination protein RecT